MPRSRCIRRPAISTSGSCAASTASTTKNSRISCTRSRSRRITGTMSSRELADPDATRGVGERLAGLVRGGDAIALVGELGAGKTTLVTGLVAALGGGDAHSPTFALVHAYD